MALCSNCGVGLSHTETICPLCHQRIKADALYSAYPANTEKVPLGLKRASMATMLGVIPAIQIVFERLVLMISGIKI